MVFLNNLFFVDSSENNEGEYIYSIRLNSEHVIYKAHFPGEPITPGVCILQIGLELLAASVGEKLEVNCVKNVKFLNILHPDGSDVCVKVRKIERDNDDVKAQVEMSVSDKQIAKMSLICRIVR